MVMIWQVIWDAFKVPISECKKERLEDGEGQALAQTAAAREEYVRKRVKGIKRKRSEIDKDLPVGPLVQSLLIRHMLGFTFGHPIINRDKQHLGNLFVLVRCFAVCLALLQ